MGTGSLTTISTCEYHVHVACTSHRPREMSSKRPVPRFREVVSVPKDSGKEIRDPRFEEAAGKLNPDLFKKSYAFVDDLKKQERQLVQKELRKAKGSEKKARLQHLLLQMV